jgi:hypothetical protein
MSPLLTGLFDKLFASRHRQVEPQPQLSEKAAARTESRATPRRPCADRALLEWFDDRDERHAEIVWVQDRSSAGLGVRSPYRLKPGWPVLVTLGEEVSKKAMVRYCEADSGDWRAGLKLIEREKRRYDRIPVHGLATVVWQSARNTRRQARARILDVCEGGVGLSGEAAIPNDTPVCVLHDGWQRFGSVTHGRTEGERYVFGVQFAGPPQLSDSPDYRD